MQWTKKIPTEPGFYWQAYEDGTYPSAVRVAKDLRLGLCVRDGEYSDLITEADGYLWFGPLTPPNDQDQNARNIAFALAMVAVYRTAETIMILDTAVHCMSREDESYRAGYDQALADVAKRGL